MEDQSMDRKVEMTTDEFATLGDGHVGYIKAMSGADAAEQFGITSEIEAGQTLYVLHSADGKCMAIADSMAGAQANAWEQNLRTVSVH